jgi:hypothetical protein
MKVRIVKGSFIPNLLRVDGITLYPFIFLAPKSPPASLINHELIHVKQIREYGFVRFYLSYFVEFLSYVIRGDSINVSYNKISYEKEAYANQHLPQKES